MKNVLYFVIMLSGFALSGFKGSAAIEPEADAPFTLSTDRWLYVTGEKIYFEIALSQQAVDDTSRQVMIAELIGADGQRYSDTRCLLEHGWAVGKLSISDEMLSGYYYLRAYRFISSLSAEQSQIFVQVKIVNPAMREVAARAVADSTREFARMICPTPCAASLSNNYQVVEPNSRMNIAGSQFYPAGAPSPSLISVIPQSTADTSGAMFVYPGNKKLNINESADAGLWLTGTLLDARSGKPVQGKRVNLSIIGKGRDFMAVRSGADGRFAFRMPLYSGRRDLFLSSERSDSIVTRVVPDKGFADCSVNLQSPAFELSPAEQKIALRMANNLRIQGVYRSPEPNAVSLPVAEPSFYGKPTEIIVIDDYIQLPTLEEYFNELPGMVKVRKKNNHRYFKVSGLQPEMELFDPLILVDWVAVDDPEKILAASPMSVSRIEIVNVPYVKGDILYGGIVSIVSRKGDFAGIDLPASGMFLNYLFLENEPSVNTVEAPGPDQPDTRNTYLHQIAEKGDQVVFNAPRAKGLYLIKAESLATPGKKSVCFSTFEVR